MQKACSVCGVVLDLDKAKTVRASFGGQDQTSYTCPVCGATVARKLGGRLQEVGRGAVYPDPTAPVKEPTADKKDTASKGR